MASVGLVLAAATAPACTEARAGASSRDAGAVPMASPRDAAAGAPVQKVFQFRYCEAEYGRCMHSCRVELLKGTRLELGSYVRVTARGIGLVAQGYILRHRGGEIFILASKKAANATKRTPLRPCTPAGGASLVDVVQGGPAVRG